MASRLSIRLVFMALATFMFAIVSGHPTPKTVPRGLPKVPANDPFYQPPAGFESTAPGTVLRSRSVTVAIFGLIPEPIETYQILYRTTAVDGSAIATVTTVFIPWFPMTDRFVSFHTAYDSSATQCDPSYTYQLGASQTDLITSAEMLIIQIYLLQGYIVSAPDYEGPDAAFSPGHLEGMAVLDSMRAVSNFQNSGLSTNKPMIVGVGYSGGAIATGWAGALQSKYAPELKIKGWAQGGTPANLTGTFYQLDNTLFSGFQSAGVAGLLKPSAYGAQLQPVLDSVLTVQGKSLLDYANSHCSVQDLLNFPEQSLFSTSIQTLGSGLFENPTVAAVLADNVLGANQDETPMAPVFVYHATDDEVIPYADASKMVSAWCNNGANVKFTTFGNGGHATTEIVALPDVVNFVGNAFAGKTGSGCSSNTELGNSLDPFALGLMLEPILVFLVDALAQMGNKDANILKNLDVLANAISF